MNELNHQDDEDLKKFHVPTLIIHGDDDHSPPMHVWHSGRWLCILF